MWERKTRYLPPSVVQRDGQGWDFISIGGSGVWRHGTYVGAVLWGVRGHRVMGTLLWGEGCCLMALQLPCTEGDSSHTSSLGGVRTQVNWLTRGTGSNRGRPRSGGCGNSRLNRCELGQVHLGFGSEDARDWHGERSPRAGVEGRRPWCGVAQTKRWRGSEEEVEGRRRSLGGAQTKRWRGSDEEVQGHRRRRGGAQTKRWRGADAGLKGRRPRLRARDWGSAPPARGEPHPACK